MNDKDRYPAVNTSGWLDAIRFLAALIVVISHTRGQVFVEYSSLEDGAKGVLTVIFFAVSRLGHEAVIVFFVLSGFFVGGKAAERIGSGRFDWKEYTIDRVSRLWVPLVPVLFLSWIDTPFSSDSILHFFGNLIGLQTILVPPFGGNGPLWSLAFEIWFYVIPVGVWFVVSEKKFRSIGVLLLLTTMILLYFSGSGYLVVCWLGGAVAWWLRSKMNSMKFLVAGGIVSVVSIGLIQFGSAGSHAIWYGSEIAARLVGELALALGVALTLSPLQGANPGSFVSKLAQCSKFSYSLYLSHFPALIFISTIIPKYSKISYLEVATYLAIIAFLLTYSVIMYWLFERYTPAVRAEMKRRFLPEQTRDYL